MQDQDTIGSADHGLHYAQPNSGRVAKKKRGINSFGGDQSLPKSSNYDIRQQEINRYAGQLANSLSTVSKSPGPNASGSRTTSRANYN